MPHRNLFIAGVPATGKSWLGSWLAQEHGYLHIDAEEAGGEDFDSVNIRNEWDLSVAKTPALLISLTFRASGPDTPLP